MPFCFVPGCTTGYRHCNSGHFFRPPTDKFEFQKWARAISRRDKELTKTSRICDSHFDKSFYIKIDTFTIDSETVELPRIKWKLKPGAVPHIFPNVPKYFTRSIKNRKPPSNRSRALGFKRKTQKLSKINSGQTEMHGKHIGRKSEMKSSPKFYSSLQEELATRLHPDMSGSNKQAETESRTSSEEREDMPRTAELLPEAGSSYGPLFEAVEALREISNQNKESNQFHAFANHVAVQLEQLPLERALELQSEIQNIITAKRVQVLKELGHRADVVMAEEVDLKPLILPDV